MAVTKANENGLRMRAWWVMRRRVEFTVPELLATVADGTEGDAHRNLQHYLRALQRAGIVAALGRTRPTRQGSNGFFRYRLVTDCGREAPVWRRYANGTQGVFDPNSGVNHAI